MCFCYPKQNYVRIYTFTTRQRRICLSRVVASYVTITNDALDLALMDPPHGPSAPSHMGHSYPPALAPPPYYLHIHLLVTSGDHDQRLSQTYPLDLTSSGN